MAVSVACCAVANPSRYCSITAAMCCRSCASLSITTLAWSSVCFPCIYRLGVWFSYQTPEKLRVIPFHFPLLVTHHYVSIQRIDVQVETCGTRHPKLYPVLNGVEEPLLSDGIAICNQPIIVGEH